MTVLKVIYTVSSQLMNNEVVIKEQSVTNLDQAGCVYRFYLNRQTNVEFKACGQEPGARLQNVKICIFKTVHDHHLLK